MDELTDVVIEACELIRRGKILAAHHKLHQVLHQVPAAAGRLPHAGAKTTAATLYAWLMLISNAASGVSRGRLPTTAAAALARSTSVDVAIDCFLEQLAVIFDAVMTAAPPPGRARGRGEAIHADM